MTTLNMTLDLAEVVLTEIPMVVAGVAAAAAGIVFTVADITVSVEGDNNNNNDGTIVNSRNLTWEGDLMLFMP
jgi:hypothetical protein